MLQTWLAFSFPGTAISLFLPRALAPFWRVLFRNQAVGAGCAPASCRMGENVCAPVCAPVRALAHVGVHICRHFSAWAPVCVK